MPIFSECQLALISPEKEPDAPGHMRVQFGSVRLNDMYAGRNIQDYGLVDKIKAGSAIVCLRTASARLKFPFVPAPPVRMPDTILCWTRKLMAGSSEWTKE